LDDLAVDVFYLDQGYIDVKHGGFAGVGSVPTRNLRIGRGYVRLFVHQRTIPVVHLKHFDGTHRRTWNDGEQIVVAVPVGWKSVGNAHVPSFADQNKNLAGARTPP